MSNNSTKTRRRRQNRANHNNDALGHGLEPPLSRESPTHLGAAACDNFFVGLRDNILHPWYFAIPALGLGIDVFAFMPAPEQLDRIINMLVLVDGLMLGVMASLITGKLCIQLLGAVQVSGLAASRVLIMDALRALPHAPIIIGLTFDEIQSAIRRWSVVGDVSWSFCWDPETGSPTANLTRHAQLYCDAVLTGNGYAKHHCIRGADIYRPSSSYLCANELTVDDMLSPAGDTAINEIFAELFVDFNQATMYLSTSLLMSFFLYVVMSGTSFRDHRGNYAHRMQFAWYWWSLVPLVVAAAITLSMLGVVGVTMVIAQVHYVKTPHPAIETHRAGDEASTLEPMNHGMYLHKTGVISTFGATGLVVVLLTLGVFAKVLVHRRIEMEDRDDLDPPSGKIVGGVESGTADTEELIRTITASGVRIYICLVHTCTHAVRHLRPHGAHCQR